MAREVRGGGQMEKQRRGLGMGSGFVRVTLIPSIALAALSIVLTTSACADSIPLFTATRGSGTLSLNWGEGRMLWSVTGPSLSLTFAGDINVPQCIPRALAVTLSPRIPR